MGIHLQQSARSTLHISNEDFENTAPTVRRVDVCHIRIVSVLSCPQADPTGTTQCDSTVVVGERDTFLDEVFLKVRHVFKRRHVEILIVSQDEDNVGLLSTGTV